MTSHFHFESALERKSMNQQDSLYDHEWRSFDKELLMLTVFLLACEFSTFSQNVDEVAGRNFESMVPVDVFSAAVCVLFIAGSVRKLTEEPSQNNREISGNVLMILRALSTFPVCGPVGSDGAVNFKNCTLHETKDHFTSLRKQCIDIVGGPVQQLPLFGFPCSGTFYAASSLPPPLGHPGETCRSELDASLGCPSPEASRPGIKGFASAFFPSVFVSMFGPCEFTLV